MTPEEWDRKAEFMTEILARMSAAQEQDRQDRLVFEKQSRDMDARLARLFEQQTLLIAHQSERIDRADKLHETWIRQNEDFQRQALHLLNLILDRLPPFSQSTN